jgi:hypothetical protein
MAVLPPEASFDEFVAYTRAWRGEVGDAELQDLWLWRQKLLTVRINAGTGIQSLLPDDERGLTNRERERKTFAEAKSQGRNIEKLSEKATF